MVEKVGMATVALNTTAAATTCKPPMKATSNGSWQGDNPLDYALPLAIVQICLVITVTRFLAFVLRPLRQPRVIAEIIVRAPRSLLLLRLVGFLRWVGGDETLWTSRCVA